MKKIAFLTSDINGIGGVSTVVKRLCEIWENDYEIVFIGMRNHFTDRFRYIEYDSGTKDSVLERTLSLIIRFINKYTNIFNKEKYVEYLRYAYFSKNVTTTLKKILTKEEIDICIATAGTYSMLLGQISKDVATRCIGWQLNSYDAYFHTKKKYLWHQDYVFKNSIFNLDKYIVLNINDKILLKKEKGLDSEIIPNPVSYNSEKYSNLENENFMAAGHLWAGKGFDLLIKSFAEFNSKNPNWTLSIYGVGPDLNKLKRLCKKNKVQDKVFFKGNICDTREAFLTASIFCLPSRWEGMPMIALESLVMGVPIIAYDIPAIAPIIDNNKNGFIAQSYNYLQYADFMKILANNKNLRKSFGKNAKAKSENFSIEKIDIMWKKIFGERENYK